MIYVAADRHGWKVVQYVMEYLTSHGMAFENMGVASQGEDMKLETMIPPFAQKVKSDEKNIGIISCGTGVGVEVGVNKFAGIRAVLATSPKVAEWSKTYDKCNVLCLVGWETTKEEVTAILDAWFQAKYDGDEQRLEMIAAFDTWH
jgi:RpiB/LacA/LacB family sugar-phosphate isomerase